MLGAVRGDATPPRSTPPTSWATPVSSSPRAVQPALQEKQEERARLRRKEPANVSTSEVWIKFSNQGTERVKANELSIWVALIKVIQLFKKFKVYA